MISIVYACNDTYVRQTLISAVSVWKHNPDARICLIGDELSESNKNLIDQTALKYNRTIRQYALKTILPELHLDKNDRHPHTIYAKLFLEQIMDEDRVLYLDSDVVVVGSLEELFACDMSKESVAGVLMPYSEKVKNSMGIKKGSPYICDGVVLINLKLWREQHKSQECLQYIQRQKGKPPMLSEGTLNYVCQDSIKVLHPKYNLMPSMMVYELDELRELFRADYYYTQTEERTLAVQNPAIIHYMNELYNRPWRTPCDHPFKDNYLALEKGIFGKNQIDDISMSSHTRMTLWLKKHLPFNIFVLLYHIKNRI